MTRDEILRLLEERVDSALASEEPPRGIDPEILSMLVGGGETPDRRCDSYTLWAAMTALAQEVKLQGRAFKELNDTLGAQAARRERDVERDAERRCRKDALNVLIDLRDRLGRGIESVRAVEQDPPPVPAAWFERFFRKPVQPLRDSRIDALTKGYELALERLDQALGDANAHEIRCAGQLFDPRRMNAIDKEVTDAVPEGTVLEVYRSGYEWNGEVFRPAQVKVSCAPTLAQGAGAKGAVENEAGEEEAVEKEDE